MLALGMRYLTGYAVATDTASRDRSEWPPHPGRVFMALAAAWFETRPSGTDPEALHAWEEEGDALRWLESRETPPALRASDKRQRSVVTVYVPVNDMDVPKKPEKLNPKAVSKALTIIPAFRTNRQPRTFPTVRPDEEIVSLIWEDAEPSEALRSALQRVCEKVIRIGHSSSLVQMWVILIGEEPEANWVPLSASLSGVSETPLRVVGSGCLNYLSTQFNGKRIEQFFDHAVRIESAKGKAKREAQQEFESEFGIKWSRSAKPPSRKRPVLSLARRYTRIDMKSEAQPIRHSCFDPNLLILTKLEGPILGLESTWQLLTALRGAIQQKCSTVPEWISGHRSDGKPSESPHLALLPLAFAGYEHADGHLLGIALALPRAISARECGQALRPLLFETDGNPAEIILTLGNLGRWTLRQEERDFPPRALQSETWTGPSTIWASVSPVVLDRHPKRHPLKKKTDWVAEVTKTVSESCIRIGLPAPAEVDVDKTSWHRGAPRSKPGPDGFPLMPQRPGGPNRKQIHAWLRFDVPVEGPVLLGAGRYRGYGLCKPWHEGSQ